MDKRASIINVITTPLGFFALSLLIVEGFLGIVLIGSRGELSDWAEVVGIYIAAAAFFTVVGLVSLMVWKIPENLTLRGEDWNERMKMSKNWGDSSNPQTKLEVDTEPTIEQPTTEPL